jgi:hypothetical protein
MVIWFVSSIGYDILAAAISPWANGDERRQPAMRLSATPATVLDEYALKASQPIARVGA